MVVNIIQSIRHIPKGIGRLYNDTKLLLDLKSQIKPQLKRKEREHIRITSAALKKAGLFVLLQAPPVIGLLPIFIALTFPRQLLTHHFWTVADHQKYLEEEFAERKDASEQFLLHYPTAHTNPMSLPTTLTDWMTELRNPVNLTISLHEPYPSLSRCNYMFSIPILNCILPSFYLHQRLLAHSEEIIKDDQDLHREQMQMESRMDLQLAAVRRGFNPTLPDPTLYT
ncbi:hypothetical protein EON65_58255, partial [archaeon]